MIKSILGAAFIRYQEEEEEGECKCSSCDCTGQNDDYKAGYNTGYKEQKTA